MDKIHAVILMLEYCPTSAGSERKSKDTKSFVFVPLSCQQDGLVSLLFDTVTTTAIPRASQISLPASSRLGTRELQR